MTTFGKYIDIVFLFSAIWLLAYQFCGSTTYMPLLFWISMTLVMLVQVVFDPKPRVIALIIKLFVFLTLLRIVFAPDNGFFAHDPYLGFASVMHIYQEEWHAREDTLWERNYEKRKG